MFLLVRDEDVPTVATAIDAFADEQGLVRVEEEASHDPLSLLASLSAPRVFVSPGEDHVFVAGLASLDVADADEWGSELSAACETEVVALEPSEDGVRVFVFDGGELDEQIDVPLDPTGRVRAPALAELASEDARAEIEAGLVASDVASLTQAILRCFGVATSPDETAVLTFRDPLEDAPALVAETLMGAKLEGVVGGRVEWPHGATVAVMLTGAPEVEGLTLTLEGDALALVDVEDVVVQMRTRGSFEPSPRDVKLEASHTLTLRDAFLESVDAPAAPSDSADLFATMQRLMSAGEDRARNTLTLHLAGVGKTPGHGTLTVRVSAGDDVAPAATTIAVTVRTS